MALIPLKILPQPPDWTHDSASPNEVPPIPNRALENFRPCPNAAVVAYRGLNFRPIFSRTLSNRKRFQFLLKLNVINQLFKFINTNSNTNNVTR